MSANVNRPRGHPNREYRGSGPVGTRRADGRVTPKPVAGVPFVRTRRVKGAWARIMKRRAQRRPEGPYPHPTKSGPGRV